MPIRPEMADRYPDDWDGIADSIRKRADQQCECLGECGVQHRGGWTRTRCGVSNGSFVPKVDGSGRYKVVLTVAHLDHTPENCDPKNLRAMCQPCHLRYDADEHARNARATRARKQGLVPLPGLEEDDR